MKNEGHTTLADMTQGSGDNQTKDKRSHVIYRVIGLLAIIFGIIAGFLLFIALLDYAQSASAAFGFRERRLDETQVFWGAWAYPYSSSSPGSFV